MVPVLLAALAGFAPGTRAAEPAEPAPLEFLPSLRGAGTVWLAARQTPGKLADVAQPPQDPREGQAAPGGQPWQPVVSPSEVVDLYPFAKNWRSGLVWCAARVRSQTGGPRQLTVYTSGAVKLFLSGKQIIEKAEATYELEPLPAAVELPKGESLLCAAVGFRWGQAEVAVTIRAADNKRVVPGDTWLLPAPPGRAADLGAAVAQAATFSTECALVEPGQKVLTTFRLAGGWPAGVGTLTPRFTDPLGRAVAGVFPPRAPDVLATQPWNPVFEAPREPAAFYELKCELSAGEKPLATKTLRVYTVAGLQAERKKVEGELKAAEQKAGRPLPHAALAVEKAALWLQEADPPNAFTAGTLGRTVQELLEEARQHLAVESAGKDPWAGKTGYIERAYVSRVDESAQPYFVLVPSAAEKALAEPQGKARFPLVVFLHGYVPTYYKNHWWTPFGDFNASFEKFGAFLAIPFGRSNSDFAAVGEVDVLDVVAQMKRLYPIDEDRVYLYGYSMGGLGGYTIGAHYPDLWAGGVILAGWADSPLLMGTRGIETLHPFKQFLIRGIQPIDLCENFGNMPLRLFHGDADQIVPLEQARKMEKRLQEFGCDAKMTVLKGNHWSGLEVMSDEGPLQWLLQQKRNMRPAQARLKNYSLSFGKNRDVQVIHTTGELRPFEVAWGVEGDAMTIKHLEGPLARVAPSHTKVLGMEQMKGFRCVAGPEQRRSLYIVGADEKADVLLNREEVGWKNPARCGPVKEALCGPFIIAYGTAGGQEATARLKKQAEDFCEEWYAFAKGRPAVKADKGVTPEEIKAKTLWLFGEEQENALHAAAAKTGKLPIQAKDGQVKIGAKTVSLKGSGLLYIYPSPLEGAGSSSSVVVAAGVSYGAQLPTNHKYDLIPDFILFADRADSDGTGTNAPVIAGFFDGKWQLKPETMWWFEEKKPEPPQPKANDLEPLKE
jgi:predicted esterase